MCKVYAGEAGEYTNDENENVYGSEICADAGSERTAPSGCKACIRDHRGPVGEDFGMAERIVAWHG